MYQKSYFQVEDFKFQNKIYDYLEVPCSFLVKVENDSIGSYEWWGVVYKDSKPNYLVLDDSEDICIEKKDFEHVNEVELSDKLEEALQEFIKDNWTDIEDQLLSDVKLEDVYYYDY